MPARPVLRTVDDDRAVSRAVARDLRRRYGDRLEDIGVQHTLELATVFAGAGMDAPWVDDVVELVGTELEWDAAFGWLRCTLETEALMDEIEKTSTRISALVGAVEQYSYLDQVCTNLIDDAADALAGSGVLTLRTRADDAAVHVEVTDDGPGVPASVREHVFEPFVTTKPAGAGSGLGLENARRIVECRHGGSLTYNHRPGGHDVLRPLPRATAA